MLFIGTQQMIKLWYITKWEWVKLMSHQIKMINVHMLFQIPKQVFSRRGSPPRNISCQGEDKKWDYAQKLTEKDQLEANTKKKKVLARKYHLLITKVSVMALLQEIYRDTRKCAIHVLPMDLGLIV